MKTFLGSVFGCSILIFLSACSPQTNASSTGGIADTNPPPRVTVELRDGSRVIGDSVEKNFKFHSALLGEIKLNVKDIRSVEGVSSNSFKLATTNGDSLTVSFVDSEFAVRTSFGKVELPVKSVRRFSVSAGDVPGMPADLVAYYPLKGSACDATGNGNDGVVQNVTPAPDRFGNPDSAYDFTGSPNCKITINSTNLLLQPPFSCSVWVKLTGGNRDPRIIGLGHDYGGFEIGTDGFLSSVRRICFNNVTTEGVIDCLSKNNFSKTEWHYVVAVRSADTMSLYVDGQLENSVPASGRIIYKPGFGSVWLPTIGAGADIGNPYCYFAGSISDVRFYRRALEADEIRQAYENRQ